jgi:anti-sigma regulatory factor (Ser/Thr protein kinase)
MTRPEPQPTGAETSLVIDLTQPFTENDLYTLRAAVSAHAHADSLAPGTVDSLLIIVGELSSNAIRHGGGAGVLRLWVAGDQLLCQVRDQGPGITDPHDAGREPVAPTAAGGRGLWIVRQLCQDLTIDNTMTGAVVTAMIRLPAVPER